MKLPSGKRLGQSTEELSLAVFFSFFLHVVLVIAAFFLYFQASPKASVPIVYRVMLVNQSAETTPAPSQQTATPPPQTEIPKTEVRPKSAAIKKPAMKKPGKADRKADSATPKKDAIPELTRQKTAPMPEQVKPATGGTPAATGKTAAVAVETPQQDFKYSWYLKQVRDKIAQNWNPPPDAKDAKVRVLFSINRSGWVNPADVKIDDQSSTGAYGFKLAAKRAILSAKPFPVLPEDFYKQTLELSVDLMAE